MTSAPAPDPVTPDRFRGDLDAVVGERTIDIHTAYVLSAEELSDDA